MPFLPSFFIALESNFWMNILNQSYKCMSMLCCVLSPLVVVVLAVGGSDCDGRVFSILHSVWEQNF